MGMDKAMSVLFEKIRSMAAIVLAALALLGQGFPDWIRVAAIGIALLLALAWLLSEGGWIGKALKSRFFRSRLSKDQGVRLSVLLDEISNHFAYSYTLSPFHVWHNCSNKYNDKIQMNYHYYNAIGSWLHDLRERFRDPRNDNMLLMVSLSKAIYEAARLAEYVEKELQRLLAQKTLPDYERREIERSWDSARGHFNHWMDKWQLLFKEVSKTAKVTCIDYLRPLEMIG